jgi:hypothetical protein
MADNWVKQQRRASRPRNETKRGARQVRQHERDGAGDVDGRSTVAALRAEAGGDRARGGAGSRRKKR